MLRRLSAIICVVFLLSGCSKSSGPLEKAIVLREEIAKSNGCCFRVSITADYGDQVYTFGMDCETDQDGNLSFVVSKPNTIAGITGNISSSGGGLTFDDKVLAFQTIADGQITPVTAPWVFINALKGGYINGVSAEENGYSISVDDSYQEGALRLLVTVEEGVPVKSEIFWNGCRVITLSVENFTYL